jgi:hypothetical protein
MSRDPFREGAEAARARKMRSIAIALALVGFVVLVFVTTMIRLVPHAPHS